MILRNIWFPSINCIFNLRASRANQRREANVLCSSFNHNLQRRRIRKYKHKTISQTVKVMTLCEYYWCLASGESKAKEELRTWCFSKLRQIAGRSLGSELTSLLPLLDQRRTAVSRRPLTHFQFTFIPCSVWHACFEGLVSFFCERRTRVTLKAAAYYGEKLSLCN